MLYLLEKGVALRDIKPASMLINPDSLCIKFIDFSLATEVSTENALDDSFRGTPIYMAPEVLARKGHYLIFPAEMWSAGVVFWECLLGTHPFANVRTHAELALAQALSNEGNDSFKALDPPASKILSKLLHLHPLVRPSFAMAESMLLPHLKRRNDLHLHTKVKAHSLTQVDGVSISQSSLLSGRSMASTSSNSWQSVALGRGTGDKPCQVPSQNS